MKGAPSHVVFQNLCVSSHVLLYCTYITLELSHIVNISANIQNPQQFHTLFLSLPSSYPSNFNSSFSISTVLIIMTCKLLHHLVRKNGGYYDHMDLETLTEKFGLRLLVIDFCAIFMWVLKKEQYAAPLLLDKLCERSTYGLVMFAFVTLESLLGTERIPFKILFQQATNFWLGVDFD